MDVRGMGVRSSAATGIRPTLEVTEPAYNGYQGLYPGGKRPTPEAKTHPLLNSFETFNLLCSL